MAKQVTDSLMFKRQGTLAYLEGKDRLLTAPPVPEFMVGIIGCGMMGQEHIRNLLLTGRARVGGVYDPSAKSVTHALQVITASGQHSAAKVYPSLSEAIHDVDTDVLIIATPNHTHLELMRSAAGCDKAILLEKPIATSVNDAHEVYCLADTHSLPVRFGLQYRYKAIYAEAISEVFERNALGRIHSVNMLEHRFPFLDKVNQWNKFNRYSGGTLVEKCCHYFDLMNLFAGSRPQRIFALGNQAVNFRDFTYGDHQADGLDQAQVSIAYENGVLGGFSLSMFAPGAREELVLCGEAGRLQASEQALLGGENHNRVDIWRGENGASRSVSPSYPAYIARAGHHGSTFYEQLSFFDELVTGQPSGTNLADGFWSVVVGAAAQLSIERGDAVDVAEVLPSKLNAQLFDSPEIAQVQV